jgi:cystathionine beta-lyase/cystathionine gamma-synthase
MDLIEKQNMGLSLSTIRLSFGLEDPNDLILDIENALNKLV